MMPTPFPWRMRHEARRVNSHHRMPPNYDPVPTSVAFTMAAAQV